MAQVKKKIKYILDINKNAKDFQKKDAAAFFQFD